MRELIARRKLKTVATEGGDEAEQGGDGIRTRLALTTVGICKRPAMATAEEDDTCEEADTGIETSPSTRQYSISGY